MIRVINVSKKFRIYSSPADRLKEAFLNKSYHREFDALKDISFEVGPGETLGIIGENGAGKSTMLKILAGVLIPDSGIVETSGKVTGLLELGTGFNPEFSGLDNIYLNGTFLGMSRDEIDTNKQEIIDFTELGEFIKEPIKTYSSGMMMRLGFAIAIHANPACFLVDEALSVGDAYFQQKCVRKIQEFKKKGGSITFGIFLIFLFITGYKFTLPLLLFPILFVGQQLLAYTMGSILGIVVVFIRDIKEVVNVLFQFWFWLTPIVYVISIIPEPLQIFEKLNPAYWFISEYQNILCFGSFPNLYFIIVLFLAGFILLYVKQTLMRRLERDIRDFI